MTARELLDSFHTRGVGRLDGLLADHGADLEDLVWEKIGRLHGVDRHDRATWDVPGVWGGLKEFRGDPRLARIGAPALIAAVDALLGPGRWTRPRDWGGFLVHLPPPIRPAWHVPRDGWHVDMHFTHDPDETIGVRLFTLLSDVEPRGGATTVVTGSHRLVERFVRGLAPRDRHEKFSRLVERFVGSHPWLRDLTRGEVGDPGRDRALLETGASIDGVDVRVETLSGRAGDVILMHPWTLHARAPHAGDGPRFMLGKDLYRRPAAGLVGAPDPVSSAP